MVGWFSCFIDFVGDWFAGSGVRTVLFGSSALLFAPCSHLTRLCVLYRCVRPSFRAVFELRHQNGDVEDPELFLSSLSLASLILDAR